MEPPVPLTRAEARRRRERPRGWVVAWFALCLAAGILAGRHYVSRTPAPARPPVKVETRSTAPPVEQSAAKHEDLIPPIALNIDAPLITGQTPSGEGALWDARLQGHGLMLWLLGRPGAGHLRLHVSQAQGDWRAALMADGIQVGLLRAAQPDWAGTVPADKELMLKVDVEKSSGQAPTFTWSFTADPAVTALEMEEGTVGERLPQLYVAPLDQPAYTFGQPIWRLGAGPGYIVETARVPESGTYLLTAGGAERGWALELIALGPDGEATDTLGVLTPELPVTSVHLDAAEPILLKLKGTGEADLSALTLQLSPA